jgi:hypothetical protein
MKNPTFALDKSDVVLSDPEALADRLAEFLRSELQPDETDRDLLLMFVDRLFLGLCDDFEDDELMRGAEVQFSALRGEQLESLRAMQARAREALHEAMAANAGR